MKIRACQASAGQHRITERLRSLLENLEKPLNTPRIAIGELGAGGEPDTLVHRRERIAVLRIDHGTRQTGVAARPEVAVIAALDRKRQTNAERPQHIRRPGPERDDRLAGIDRPLASFDPPGSVGAVERPRVPFHHDAAERGKSRRVGAGDGERVRHAGDVGPVDRMPEYRIEAWFE